MGLEKFWGWENFGDRKILGFGKILRLEKNGINFGVRNNFGVGKTILGLGKG